MTEAYKSTIGLAKPIIQRIHSVFCQIQNYVKLVFKMLLR